MDLILSRLSNPLLISFLPVMALKKWKCIVLQLVVLFHPFLKGCYDETFSILKTLTQEWEVKITPPPLEILGSFTSALWGWALAPLLSYYS